MLKDKKTGMHPEDPDIHPSEITDKELYLNRRQFIAAATAMAAAGIVVPESAPADTAVGRKLTVTKHGRFADLEKETPLHDASHYNNFYEFSTSKEDVAELSRNFRTRPWTVSIEGHIKKPKVYNIDELIRLFPLEERIYRFRCVEAWSMVIPWTGFPLGDLLRKCEPTAKAGYVEFTTLADPAQMPGQRREVLQWPYVEGLRLDEGLHPLTLLAVGMYGETLPNQNGAPLRLVVPWKYGFKNIKSIVRIRLVEQQPVTSWMKAGPEEYGFYANVNPEADHPRWSQAKERRIGELIKRKTLMFNGYADQVAGMYSGMDLGKFF
jgi:sulfoxide reductase catalytic subunit YedY